MIGKFYCILNNQICISIDIDAANHQISVKVCKVTNYAQIHVLKPSKGGLFHILL